MPKDRDQLTPDDADDRELLEQNRGQGTAGTGLDRLPGEEAPESMHEGGTAPDDAVDEPGGS